MKEFGVGILVLAAVVAGAALMHYFRPPQSAPLPAAAVWEQFPVAESSEPAESAVSDQPMVAVTVTNGENPTAQPMVAVTVTEESTATHRPGMSTEIPDAVWDRLIQPQNGCPGVYQVVPLEPRR